MTKDKKMGQEQSKNWFKELKDMTPMEIFELSPTAIIDEGNTAADVVVVAAAEDDDTETEDDDDSVLACWGGGDCTIPGVSGEKMRAKVGVSKTDKDTLTVKVEDKAEGSAVALTDGEVGINKDAWSHDDIKKLLKLIEEFSDDYDKVFACFSHKTEEEFRPMFSLLVVKPQEAGIKKGKKKRSGNCLRNPSPRKKPKLLPLALRRLENSAEWDESNNLTFIRYSFYKQDGTLVTHTCRLDSLLIMFSTIEEERKATNGKSLLSWIDKSNPRDKEIHDALELAFDYLKSGDTAMGREVFSSLIDKESEGNWYGDMNDALTRIFKPIIGPILTCKCECEECAHVVEHGRQLVIFILTAKHPRGFFGAFDEYLEGGQRGTMCPNRCSNPKATVCPGPCKFSPWDFKASKGGLLLFSVVGIEGLLFKDIPEFYDAHDKRYKLVAATGHGADHFVAYVRRGKSWLFYDGLDKKMREYWSSKSSALQHHVEDFPINNIVYEDMDDVDDGTTATFNPADLVHYESIELGLLEKDATTTATATATATATTATATATATTTTTATAVSSNTRSRSKVKTDIDPAFPMQNQEEGEFDLAANGSGDEDCDTSPKINTKQDQEDRVEEEDDDDSTYVYDDEDEDEGTLYSNDSSGNRKSEASNGKGPTDPSIHDILVAEEVWNEDEKKNPPRQKRSKNMQLTDYMYYKNCKEYVDDYPLLTHKAFLRLKDQQGGPLSARYSQVFGRKLKQYLDGDFDEFMPLQQEPPLPLPLPVLPPSPTAVTIPGVPWEKLDAKIRKIVHGVDQPEDMTVTRVRAVLEEWLDLDLTPYKDTIRTMTMKYL